MWKSILQFFIRFPNFIGWFSYLFTYNTYKMFTFQFAVALVIVFLLELAAGITAAVYKSDFQEALKTTLRNSMNKYSDENSNNDKIAWDNVQKKVLYIPFKDLSKVYI